MLNASHDTNRSSYNAFIRLPHKRISILIYLDKRLLPNKSTSLYQTRPQVKSQAYIWVKLRHFIRCLMCANKHFHDLHKGIFRSHDYKMALNVVSLALNSKLQHLMTRNSDGKSWWERARRERRKRFSCATSVYSGRRRAVSVCSLPRCVSAWSKNIFLLLKRIGSWKISVENSFSVFGSAVAS